MRLDEVRLDAEPPQAGGHPRDERAVDERGYPQRLRRAEAELRFNLKPNQAASVERASDSTNRLSNR